MIVVVGVALLALVFEFASRAALPPHKFLTGWIAVVVTDKGKTRAANDDDGIRAYTVNADYTAVLAQVSRELDPQGIRTERTENRTVFFDSTTGGPRVKLVRDVKAGRLILERFGTQFAEAKLVDIKAVGWVTAVVYVPSQPTLWESLCRRLGF